MKKSILVLGLASVFAFASCQQKFERGPGGLEYKILKDAGNPKAEAGDLMSLNLIIKSDRDSILTNTYDIGLPQIINIFADSMPGLYDGDYNTMFKMLGEGDSAIFKIDLDTLQAKTNQPKPEFADKYFIFEVKANKVFKKGNLTDSALYAEVNTYFENEIAKLKESEENRIENFVKSDNKDYTKTESGLRYHFLKKGTGIMPEAQDTIIVHYTGKLISGKVFDTSIEEIAKKEGLFNPQRNYQPVPFVIGVGQVIPGWDEGILLSPNGSEVVLLIPSNLAYGEQGEMRAGIPPFAPLIFEIDIVDLKKFKEQQ